MNRSISTTNVLKTNLSHEGNIPLLGSYNWAGQKSPMHPKCQAMPASREIFSRPSCIRSEKQLSVWCANTSHGCDRESEACYSTTKELLWYTLGDFKLGEVKVAANPWIDCWIPTGQVPIKRWEINNWQTKWDIHSLVKKAQPTYLKLNDK